MSEDGTRTSLGFGLGADGTKASSDKKIQVRLANGKVYGPYVRSEVLSFIYAKKLTGEETILVEGTPDWVPITSDLEFFDAFQEVLFGKKSADADSEKSSQESKSGGSDITRTEVQVKGGPKGSEKPKAKKEPAPAVRSGSGVQYSGSGDGRVIDLGRGRSSPSIKSGAQDSEGAAENLFRQNEIPTAAMGRGAATKNKKKVSPVLVGLIALLLVIAYLQIGPKSANNSVDSRAFGTFSAQSWYARPLVVAMDGFVPQIGSLPSNLISSPELSFPEGFNAIVWIEDLKNLESRDPKEKLLSGWWLRWAWDAYWLGMTVWTFDKTLGESLMGHALAIVNRVESMGILKEPAASMFKGAQEIRDLNWEAAIKSFDLVSAQNPIAAWLNEDSTWQLFWSKGAKGVMPKRVVTEYESGPLETSSQVRSAFVDRDETRYKDWTEQLAGQDPLSTTLWFTTAQVNWRFNKEGAATANKLFSIGLGSLALQPQPIQFVYWTQYAEFLSAFGRQATTSKALNNRDSIKSGNIERDSAALRKWWDLNQPEFDLNSFANEVFVKAERGIIENRDLATLFVLGYVVPAGGKYLAVSGNHFALEKNWGKALQIFNQIVKVDKTSIDAWGGLVWVNASLFKFDEAFEALDEINRLKPLRMENYKFEALLYSLGREYEKATELFEQYISKAPNDPWAHYFNAKNFLAQEQNVKCVGSANLALAHSAGELRQKADLLLHKCRVLAKIQAKDALGDLKKMAEAEPNNPAVAIEYIDAQLAMDLDASAAEFTENTIRRFPRSFDLRMKRGDIYRKNGDYDRAVAFYTRASRDRPESIDPMIKIAEVLESQGKVQQAAESFEAASFKSPDYPEVFLMAARAYAKARRFADASRLFEKEIHARPAHVGAFLEAADFFLQANDPNSVIRISSKLSPDYQEHPRVRLRVAQAYFASRQIEKAVEEAQRTIGLDPKVGEAYRILGLGYEEMGQYDLARTHLEKYLLLVPGAVDGDQIIRRLNSPPYR